MQDRKGLVQQEALGPAEQQNYLFDFYSIPGRLQPWNGWTILQLFASYSAAIFLLLQSWRRIQTQVKYQIFQEKVEEAKKLNQGKENKERRIGIQATVNDSKQ